MYQSNIIQTDVYNTYFLQFYDDGVMIMDSVPFGGKSSEHFANHQNDSNESDFQNFEVLIAVLDMTLTSNAGE